MSDTEQDDLGTIPLDDVGVIDSYVDSSPPHPQPVFIWTCMVLFVVF
jgi:hypothetical protein